MRVAGVRCGAPGNAVEQSVGELWADLLGLEKVGALDDFFELGGNSLVMMQVNVRLRSLYGVSLPIRDLFELPSVELLSERVDSVRRLSQGPERETPDDIEEFTI